MGKDLFNHFDEQFADEIVNGMPLSFRHKPPFSLTLDLDGKIIGKFWYEDKQLKFEGETDESAEVWVGWVIGKFQEWHDEHIT